MDKIKGGVFAPLFFVGKDDKFISFYHFIMACIISRDKIKDFKCFAKEKVYDIL